jgi:hypothetical protein
VNTRMRGEGERGRREGKEREDKGKERREKEHTVHRLRTKGRG